MVGSDQPKHGGRLVDTLLGADEFKDVRMLHVRQLEDLLLGLPRVFVRHREYFDGHLVSFVLCTPHGTESTVSFLLDQMDGSWTVECER